MKNSLIKIMFFTEILKGMAITFRTLFKPAVTRRYPLVKVPAQPGFRGLHALAKDNTGRMKCVGCGLCGAYCPSQCIHIHTTEGDDHNKIVERYEVDVVRCIFCGFCVEACPFGASRIGNIRDPKDPVTKIIRTERVGILKEEFGFWFLLQAIFGGSPEGRQKTEIQVFSGLHET